MPARTVHFHPVSSADGTEIEVWSNDADGPTVLLCNGLGSNPFLWPGLLDPDCEVRVLSWMHRGTGRSARPGDRSRIGIDAFVEDALAVLDDAGIARCVVAGWSFGVSTAFELALRYPERVAGLFAVAGVPGANFASMGAPLFIPRPWREPISLGAARALTGAGPMVTPAARRLPVGPVTTTALRFSGFMWPTASSEHVSRSVREFLTTPVEWYGRLALAASTHRRVPVGALRMPATFVAGRYDLLASTHDMRATAERMRDAEFVELWGGHFLPLERPARVTALLGRLVEQVG